MTSFVRRFERLGNLPRDGKGLGERQRSGWWYAWAAGHTLDQASRYCFEYDRNHAREASKSGHAAATSFQNFGEWSICFRCISSWIMM